LMVRLARDLNSSLPQESRHPRQFST
jgi:hypothetical protein